MNKVGFIGMGNMGYAILKGLLSVTDKKSLFFTCMHEEHARQVRENTGVSYSLSNADCVKNCKYIFLAVKPQVYDGVLEEIKPFLLKSHIVISLAPGYSINIIKEKLGDSIRVIRAMPNTPAMVFEGMTGVCIDNKRYTSAEKKEIHRIFTSFGKAEYIDEKQMDTVVALSGSSPAWFYIMVDALADMGVKLGMKKDISIRFAAQSMLGSAKMILESGEHPAVLKDRVCSPGGTTIAGVEALEENGFRKAVYEAVKACNDACRR